MKVLGGISILIAVLMSWAAFVNYVDGDARAGMKLGVGATLFCSVGVIMASGGIKTQKGRMVILVVVVTCAVAILLLLSSVPKPAPFSYPLF